MTNTLSKICKMCQAALPLKDFYEYHKGQEVYLMPYCIPCNKKRLKEWRAANPERVRAAQRARYRRRNPIPRRHRLPD